MGGNYRTDKTLKGSHSRGILGQGEGKKLKLKKGTFAQSPHGSLSRTYLYYPCAAADVMNVEGKRGWERRAEAKQAKDSEGNDLPTSF